MVANLESKGGGTLRELDVLRVIGSISAAQVGTAERRGLRIHEKNNKHMPHRAGSIKERPVIGDGGEGRRQEEVSNGHGPG